MTATMVGTAPPHVSLHALRKARAIGMAAGMERRSVTACPYVKTSQLLLRLHWLRGWRFGRGQSTTAVSYWGG